MENEMSNVSNDDHNLSAEDEFTDAIEDPNVPTYVPNVEAIFSSSTPVRYSSRVKRPVQFPDYVSYIYDPETLNQTMQ